MMERTIRFLSGEVPGGFFLYFVIVAVVLFFYWFMMHYSEVINRKKLREIVFSLVGLMVFTYVIVRIARPPQPENIYMGFLPFEITNKITADSASDREVLKYSGTGWIIAEMAARNGQSASPSHINFLRPEWLFDSFNNDSAGSVSYAYPPKLLAWARLIKLKYLAAGSFEVRDKDIDVRIDIYNTETEQPIQQIHRSFLKYPSHTLIGNLGEFSSDLAKTLYELTGEPYKDVASVNQMYRSPALFEYARGRYLLAKGYYDSSVIAFRNSVKNDSGSVLAWYGLGTAHGEWMIRTDDAKLRDEHQKRSEIYLKKSGQLDSLYEPVYSALAKYYMFIKPEPRYLQAEFALMAAYDLYDRDYLIYYILSYMQKMRWDTFKMKSKEEVLQKAIEVNPAGFVSYLALAQTYLQRSRAHDIGAQWALNNYAIAQKLRPNDMDAILGMAVAMDYVGYYDKAIEQLQRAQRLYPNNAEVYYNLGVIHFHIAGINKAKKKSREETEEYKLAEPYFKKAIAINNHHYSYLYLGRIYDFQNRKAEAIETFRICMKLFDKEDPYREEARKKLREYFPNVE
jgi:tetratricopeptide (TPR) repeat protein